jgi:hypothetical protein
MRAAVRLIQAQNHHMFAEKLIDWLTADQIQDEEAWFYHATRELIEGLLANPACSEADSEILASWSLKLSEYQRATH